MSKALAIVENMRPLTGGEFLMSDADRVSLINAINYLEEDSDWLNCLEAAGVDNWSGYDEARAIQRGEYD